jgi:hypothetical protein
MENAVGDIKMGTHREQIGVFLVGVNGSLVLRMLLQCPKCKSIAIDSNICQCEDMNNMEKRIAELERQMNELNEGE